MRDLNALFIYNQCTRKACRKWAMHTARSDGAPRAGAKPAQGRGKVTLAEAQACVSKGGGYTVSGYCGAKRTGTIRAPQR